jgi:LAO/AO transport system kinase
MAPEVLVSGGKRAMAAALTQIEQQPDTVETADLLDHALTAQKGLGLGLTGPPGVGKSTLIDRLIAAWRARGQSVAVIAVDPSSRRSGGALLGDRTRLNTDPDDDRVFVRSMAARDHLGGVAAITFPALVLLRAVYDVVIVETVGVGQSETEIAETADLTAVCIQPGSGDALQFMKAGLMEIPDLLIVTKTDMGPIAERTITDLKGAMSLTTDSRLVACSAATGTGISAVLDEISAIAAKFSPLSCKQRNQQMIRWSESQILRRFGEEGLKLAKSEVVDNPPNFSFREMLEHHSRLSDAMTAAFRSRCDRFKT